MDAFPEFVCQGYVRWRLIRGAQFGERRFTAGTVEWITFAVMLAQGSRPTEVLGDVQGPPFW
ncbi:hypothetical protein [Streptomyces chartreusis]